MSKKETKNYFDVMSDSFALCHLGGGPTGQQQPQQTREMNAQFGPGPSLRPQSKLHYIGHRLNVKEEHY
jgi:hypothetical protein